MAKIANVALTNTFDTWRSRSNEAFDRLSQFAINNSSLYANTLTANSSFTAKGLATMQGRATIGTNLTVSGNTTLGGASKTVTIGGAGATANVTGWFGVAGRATVSTNLFVGANAYVMGSVGIGTNTPLAATNYRFVTVQGGSAGGGYSLYNSSGTEISRWGTDNAQIGIYNWTSSLPTTFQTNSIERMRIASSGLVTACNSMTVTQNLTVSGNTYIGGTGRLGIGTTTPGDAISVARSTGEAVISITNSGTASSWLTLAPGSAGSAYIHNTGNVPTIFTTNSVEAFRLASSGLGTFAKSLTVTQNLTVSGNTTLNGTTIDKSNSLSQTLTDTSGSIVTTAKAAWDVADGRVATITLTGTGRTMPAPLNLKVGTYILTIIQDATGSRTVTWNSVFKWTAGVAPPLTTTANAKDVFSFFSDGTNMFGSFMPDVR